MKRRLKGMALLLSILLVLSGCGEGLENQSGTAAKNWDPAGSFCVHFIDVGQADAALVLCDGEAMLIDGGNAEDSNLIYAYLKKHEISHLSYVVGTHAHEDHIGGLPGALQYATADVVYCPTTTFDSRAFENFVRSVEQNNLSITVPDAGEKFSLGSASCEILAVNTQPEDPNNSSIVLKIDYGQTSFVFTADAETPVEEKLLESEKPGNVTVLKVGHHGSSTSTGYSWLWHLMPEYAVISVGADNEYGHPHDEVLSRLRDGDITTFRTDIHGDILCVSDGKQVEFSVSRNQDEDPFRDIGGNSTQKTEGSYVVNKSSGKFHLAHCSSVDTIKAENRWDYTGTREELVQKGYTPCKKCDP